MQILIMFQSDVHPPGLNNYCMNKRNMLSDTQQGKNMLPMSIAKYYIENDVPYST